MEAYRQLLSGIAANVPALLRSSAVPAHEPRSSACGFITYGRSVFALQQIFPAIKCTAGQRVGYSSCSWNTLIAHSWTSGECLFDAFPVTSSSR